jgi:isopenicillin-N N-acyltransferase like protein
MSFYAGLFAKTAKLDWPKVQELALTFEPVMRRKWPAYLEEMSAVAEGAGVELADIIAINVRTEINFGLFSDGCTALSWRTEDSSFLAQNWDWMEEQKANLIILTIEQPKKPTIKMVTEAGIIGKIGLNSAGVGVCLNAIRVKGMDNTRIPCHLGLRMVLESTSREEAVQKLEKYGVASSCHMLVADPTGGIGLEWSSVELAKIQMNASNQVFHSNHYIAKHVGVEDTNWLGDSTFRVSRIEELCKPLGTHPTGESLFNEVFRDETNYPGAICRSQVEPSGSATLFNIIMHLKEKKATVSLGRPVAVDEVVQLGF